MAENMFPEFDKAMQDERNRADLAKKIAKVIRRTSCSRAQVAAVLKNLYESLSPVASGSSGAG